MSAKPISSKKRLYRVGERDRYIYWLVQGETDVARRQQEVARHTIEYELTESEQGDLRKSLAALDARRAAPKCDGSISSFLAIPEPTRQDFEKLKVGGKDSYSSMSYPMLRAAATDASPIIEAGNLDDPDKAKAYRWVCRGLTPAQALEKVAVDQAVSASVQYVKEERAFWDQPGAEEAALDALKDGDDLHDVIHPAQDEPDNCGFTFHKEGSFVRILQHGKCVGVKDGITSQRHFDHFKRKFLADLAYRQQYLRKQTLANDDEDDSDVDAAK